MSELSTAIVAIVSGQSNPGAAAREAIDALTAMVGGGQATATRPAACGCGGWSPRPRAQFNKMRTILKKDAPGFSDESLRVYVKSRADRDVLIINAANEFRHMHEEETVLPAGMRLDRDTLKAQLRLGVLKVTGRTYKRDTPISAMDLSDKVLVPVMMPNHG